MKIYKVGLITKPIERVKTKEGKIVVKRMINNVQREISFLSELNHPNISRLVQLIYEKDKNKLYIMLDYYCIENIIRWNAEAGEFDPTLVYEQLKTPNAIKRVFRMLAETIAFCKFISAR